MAGFQVTKQQAEEWRNRAERLMARAKNITEKSEETVGQVIRTMEVGGAAFAAGVLKGRYGTVEVAGVPADLGASAGLHLVGFFGGGKYKEHLHSLGDGVLASYLTTVGAGIGDRMARENASAALPAAAPPAPVLAPGAAASGHELAGNERLSDAELQVLRSQGLR
jgi:hypothetical protein